MLLIWCFANQKEIFESTKINMKIINPVDNKKTEPLLLSCDMMSMWKKITLQAYVKLAFHG